MRNRVLYVALLLPLVAAVGWTTSSREGMTGAVVIESQEAVAHVPIVPVTARVAYTDKPIRPDGDLADWNAAGIKPLVLAGDNHASWFKGVYGGKKDLAVSVWLCRDERYLYVAVRADDDRTPATDRFEIAFAPNDSKLIATWRDVGMRYGADDVHVTFAIGNDDSLKMSWAHLQRRMDSNVANNSFGTEAERRAFLEQNSPSAEGMARILAMARSGIEAGRGVSVIEIALPWKLLAPYVPVSYAPLKCNIAVHDIDDDGGTPGRGVVAWTPGLVGTYSAAHFATLEFDRPATHKGIDCHAQVPASRFVNQDIRAAFSFFNHTATTQTGSLELGLKPWQSRSALASDEIALPPGFSEKQLQVHSERISQSSCHLLGHLRLNNGTILEIPVHAPTLDDAISIQPLKEVLNKVAELEEHAATLGELCRRAEAKGLDMSYPLAHKTLQEMFLKRCRVDIKAGDAERVLRNCSYLSTLFDSARAYLEKVLTDPAAQLRVPSRLAPDRLRMKQGYWFADGKPVFLWGPCTFWYLRQDQPLVAGLGFNCVCPELPLDPANKDAVEHMEAWARMGLAINAGLGVPDFNVLKKQHPEIANLDQNNFLPFLVQHPIPRQAITEHYRKSIDFYRSLPGVISYWLWNEPWYLNYSEPTRQDFITQYLQPRYSTVGDLNSRWHTNYRSYDQVKLIQWPDAANYAPWYDFQQFRDDLLADFFAFLHDTAREADPTRPTHTKFMAASLHSFNIEKFQAPFEIAGFDGSISDRDIVFLDYCRSLYPDRPLVNTEIHIHYGGHKAVELVAWRLALHGLANGNWWCWHSNPRFSDSLGNAESMHALAFSGLDVRRLFDPYLYALNRKAPEVATLFPDVVERRSDVKMVRIRHELAAAQYALGLKPFYVTEKRIATGGLGSPRVLLAGESDYVRDSTYRGVMDFAGNGGTVIVTRGGFAHNEYGDPRDAAELVRPEGGEPYGPGARTYALGKGQVICIDTVANEKDVVQDGGQVLRERPLPENEHRRFEYQQVLDRVMTANGLVDPVRLVAADASADDPGAMYGIDWRSAETEAGHVLAAIPYASTPPFAVKLVTTKPIRQITNLITGKQIAPASFALEDGPNLFLVELAPNPGASD